MKDYYDIHDITLVRGYSLELPNRQQYVERGTAADGEAAAFGAHHELWRNSNGTEVTQSFLERIIHYSCTTYQAY